jgi:hypothetical protein
MNKYFSGCRKGLIVTFILTGSGGVVGIDGG